MSEPLENLYFNWLCAKVVFNENPAPSNTYWRLLRTLHNTEFVWLLSGDDNRAEDGLELRREFILQVDAPDYPEWRRNPGCSMLEMFIAFSRRAEFISSVPATEWFWEFMKNLGLEDFNDAYLNNTEIIDDILDTFIWRTYDYNSSGGLFPLNKADKDQREVELWYQFANYLIDQDRLP